MWKELVAHRRLLSHVTCCCSADSHSHTHTQPAGGDEPRREQPAIFADSPGGTLIVSPGRFYVGIINKLDEKGICGEGAYRSTCWPAAF